MRVSLKQLISAPHFEDEDQMRVAGVLHTALASIMVIAAAMFFALPFTVRPLNATLILVSVISISWVGLLILHSGHIRRSGAVCCAMFWMFSTVLALISGGLSSPAVFAYIGVITIAGLVFHGRAAAWAAAFCFASSGMLALLTLNDFLPPMLVPPTALMTWLTQTAIFAWLAWILIISTHGTENALFRLRSKERELQTQTADLTRLNWELQEEVLERQKAIAAVRESEQRFRAAVNHMPDMFVIYGIDRRFRFVNTQVLQVIGCTLDDVLGRTDEEVFPSKITETYLPLLQRTIETAQTHTNEVAIDIDNEKHSLIVTYVPLFDAQGQLHEVLGIVRDVTQQKVVEQALQAERAHLAERVQERTAELSRANAQLIEAVRTKDAFLATINHELRTPLTSVMLGTQMLQSDICGGLSREQKQFVDMIERNGQHLLTLINDILHFSKLEAGKFAPDVEPVNVPQICQECVSLVQDLAHIKQIDVQFDIETHIDIMRADPRSLHQILINLLSNGVKFTPEGGQVGLRVALDCTQQIVRFTVWDTGIGIAPEDMTRLFQPFVQIDSSLSRQYEGSGLGLALVKRLTELHGGSIAVQSTLDEGSEFTVSLPLQPHADGSKAPRIHKQETEAQPTNALTISVADDRPAPWRAESTADVAQPLTPPRTPTVLVAEDTEHTLHLLELFLGHNGFQVVVARNGIEAIERTQEDHPDLILLDVQMPFISGLEVIERIRAQEDTSHIPIIALTALTMPGDRETCLNAGANLYLPKPINLNILLDRITELLAETEKAPDAPAAGAHPVDRAANGMAVDPPLDAAHNTASIIHSTYHIHST